MPPVLGPYMVSQCGKSVSLREEAGPSLAQVFAPVSREMEATQAQLTAISTAAHPMVRVIVDFLLEAPGKRIRPALVFLSAKAVHPGRNGSIGDQHPAVNMAAAVELIHMASLVHDDLIDDATVRHHRPSVHVKWGKQVAAKLGAHLCAKAFELVADCADPRLFAVLGPPLCAMCAGEMEQVADRGDFTLGESDCLALVEKKTAALFGACCGAGAVAGGSGPGISRALQEFGRCFGIAFQLLDDCKDFLCDQQGLGKTPGQDLQIGDVTLPLLYALESEGGTDGRAQPASPGQLDGRGLADLREAFRASAAPARVAQRILSYVEQAKQALQPLVESDYKGRLFLLVDGMAVSASHLLET